MSLIKEKRVLKPVIMSDPQFITLTAATIENEHICCAFSDKKCKEGYNLKKEWLAKAFASGYVFRRLDARAKVFIEYCPSESAWLPVVAPNYLMINCFWVSGQYKGKGYAKALLQSVLNDAAAQHKDGLVTVAGTSKFHFMSDAKWLLRQGFEVIETLPSGFSLLGKKFNSAAATPSFTESAINGECPENNGLVVYYSHRCPFTHYHVHNSLVEAAKNLNLPLKIIHLSTLQQAQSAPTPATIFSLFYKGKFLTTDVSACMESRLVKILKLEASI